MLRKGLVVLAVMCLAFMSLTSYLPSDSGAEAPHVGRYRFYAPPTGGVGYRLDTATGELRQLYIGGESLIWDGIEGANVIGRFDLVPKYHCQCDRLPSPPTWYLVDTATGYVWHVSPSGISYVGGVAEE